MTPPPMNDALRRIYSNDIVVLEAMLRGVRRERVDSKERIRNDRAYERMLALRYHLLHRRLTETREKLCYPAGRDEPAWVRKYTHDPLPHLLRMGKERRHMRWTL